MSSSPALPSLHDLVQRAQRGEQQALAELLAILRPRLEDMARGYADPAHADESTQDLVQEAWLRAWQKLDLFTAGKSEEETRPMLYAWVGQIVHRLGLNAVRDRAAQKRSPQGRAVLRLEAPEAGSSMSPAPRAADAALAHPGPTPSGIVSQDEEAIRVRAAIEALEDATDRTILQLRFVDGVSLRQIAERLGLSYDRVRDRFGFGLRHLQRHLEGLR